MMDGKLLLVSNVADLTPTEVVSRYRQQVLACMHGKSDAFDGVARIRHALGHWVWAGAAKVLTKLARGRALTLIDPSRT